jgi:beta-glucuronidase
MRTGVRILLACAALTLVLSGAAQAQTYAASPPTAGALYRDGQAGRYLLGGTWLSRLDLADVGQAQGWWRDVPSSAGWTPVTMPNSNNARDLSDASMAGYVGWYRRDFTLPENAFASYVRRDERRWVIHFDSVNYRATVWLNGHRLGLHTGAYLPFEFLLKRLRPGVNRLVMRVDDRRTGGDLPPGPSGGWWNYGGVLGDVYLRAVQGVDIAQVQVRPVVRCPTCRADVQEQAIVQNLTGRTQTVSLHGSYGPARLDFGSAVIAPHGTWTAQASARIAHPRLWAPGSPSLYRAGLTLNDAQSRRLAAYVTYSGIRNIQLTSGGRLKLNGRLLDIRGFNLHEQELGSGAALSVAQMRQLIDWVRELGATMIRAHYPLSPEMEEMADRDGILLWSEVPVYQTRSQYFGQRGWLRRAHALVTDNILTNQNHPSILLWSIGNELPAPATAAQGRYIASTVALAHRLDPTRPVGMAVSAWPGLACQSAYRALDVVGYNDYFGWFDAGGGTTDDRDALSPFLDSFRACYADKAVFITEFGFEANRHGPVDERGTYEFQDDSTAFHLAVFASKPWLSGALYFPLQDFAAHPGWGGGDPWPNPPFVQKGMVDLYGNHRPVFDLVRSIYSGTAQIAPPR